MSVDAFRDPPAPDAAASRPSRRPRTPAVAVRERRRRLALWLLSTALCILVVNALVGESGYLATVAARRELAALEGRVARLRLENQQLQQEGRRLETDPSALEETARRELGLVRPGETLIVIHDTTRPETPASR
jgi:cell division protein FtsB